MKHIVKGAAPKSFEDWKAQKNEDWKPSYGDLQNPQKADLHEALLKEQGWVCCYCGRCITQADSHIEHFRPQKHYEDHGLNYANLHASCILETKPGMPLHCGHAKSHDFEEAKHISPLEKKCEQRFTYTLVGEIKAADNDERAEYMCALLRLDIHFLCNRREEALRRVFDPAFLVSASDVELNQLASAFRTRNGNGQLDGFGHVVARFAEQQRVADTAES